MPGWFSVRSATEWLLGIPSRLTQIAYTVSANATQRWDSIYSPDDREADATIVSKIANGIHRDATRNFNAFYPSDARKRDALEFAQGMQQGFNISTFISDKPKTYENFNKWGRGHIAYARNRFLMDLVAIGILMAIGDPDASTWSGFFISASIYLAAFAAISVRWTIFQAIYYGLIGGSAYEESSHDKSYKQINYKGAWLDKTIFAGLQSSLHYLSDYHLWRVVGSAVSGFIPGTKWLLYAITDGRSLVEYSIVANSKDGVPFQIRREILANNLPYAFGLGTALYSTYSLLSFLIQYYVGYSHPVIDAAMYNALYAIFVLQAYQIRELPGTTKRIDVFMWNHEIMDMLLQRGGQRLIQHFERVLENGKSLSASPKMPMLLKTLVGFESVSQYANREEIGDWLLANEYGINLFFAIVLGIQDAYKNKITLVAIYAAESASKYLINNDINVPHNIGDIVKECLVSPLLPLAKKYLAEIEHSPITPEVHNTFKLLINGIKANRRSETETRRMSQQDFGPGKINVFEGYNADDQAINIKKERLKEIEEKLKTMEGAVKNGITVISPATSSPQAPVLTLTPQAPVLTSSPQALSGDLPKTPSQLQEDSHLLVNDESKKKKPNLSLFVVDDGYFNPTQTASPPPESQQQQGTKPGSH